MWQPAFQGDSDVVQEGLTGQQSWGTPLAHTHPPHSQKAVITVDPVPHVHVEPLPHGGWRQDITGQHLPPPTRAAQSQRSGEQKAALGCLGTRGEWSLFHNKDRTEQVHLPLPLSVMIPQTCHFSLSNTGFWFQSVEKRSSRILFQFIPLITKRLGLKYLWA